jgi:hypothetical protein
MFQRTMPASIALLQTTSQDTLFGSGVGVPAAHPSAR